MGGADEAGGCPPVGWAACSPASPASTTPAKEHATRDILDFVTTVRTNLGADTQLYSRDGGREVN